MPGKGWAAIGVVGCLIVLAILASVLFQATGGFRADVHPGALETGLANWAKGWYIWHAAGDQRNPVPATKANVNLGQQIFGAECAICHGLKGKGKGPVGPMNPPASDLADKESQHWTDAQLFWIIEHGIRFSGMPSWKHSVSTRQAWLMVDFIRSLKTP